VRISHRCVQEFAPWGIILTFLSLRVAILSIMIDLEDRQSERTFRAWQIVRGFETGPGESDAYVRTGGSGSSLRQALEYLNREFEAFLCASWVRGISETVTGNLHRTCLILRKIREFLVGISANSADLSGIDLRGTDLSAVKLTRVDLSDANLSEAELDYADLTGATLRNSDLTSAKLHRSLLRYTDLTNANLSVADVTDALFEDTEVTGAYLATSLAGLTQLQLDNSCGTSSPLRIPAGLTWRQKACSPFRDAWNFSRPSSER